MVGRLMQLMQYSHLSAHLGCSRKNSIAEIVLGDHLRTAECKENATFLDALQTLHIETGIALQCIAQSSTVLGKGWRIEHDEVVLLVVLVKILESIFSESLMTGITWEVERHIIVSQLYSLGTAVYRVYLLGIATHGINREATCVAEHIEHALALGILLQE